MKKPIIIAITLVLVALLVFSACSNNSTRAKFIEMSGCWPRHKDADALIERADLVFVGRITDISFAVVDPRNGQYVDETTEERYRYLYTFYEFEVFTLLKGDTLGFSAFTLDGGVKNFRIEEQLRVMNEGRAYDRKWGIYVWQGHPNPQIGETYLFALAQTVENAPPVLLNLNQSIYPLNAPMERQGTASPYEIISHFGEEAWNSFYTEWQRSDSIYRTQQTS